MLTDNLNAPLILVVEDDENHAELMRISLQNAQEEFRLEIAATLLAARAFIDRQTPDLVLTDYRLPDGDGSALLLTVKGLCPVILLTSQGNEQVAVDAMKAGVQDYVVKTAKVFSGMWRIVQRGMREWTLIQEKMRAEEERLQMERHLLHIRKLESLGTMSGGIAHDFNNLLHVILGNLELSLLNLSGDNTVRNFICQARSAAEQAADLSGMMLDYSGKGMLEMKALNLTEFIEGNVSMLRAVFPMNIKFKLELDRTLPLIMADGHQLQQVIMSLITNAIEAVGTAAGTITLASSVRMFDQSSLDKSSLVKKPAAGSYVCLEITDSGCGMDEVTLDKLFDPFFTTKFTGRGLGISAAQGIIRAHNGAIIVESTPGAGTTVRVLLPIADCSGADQPLRAVVAVETAILPGTILIVDDEAIIRMLMEEMVVALGFDALTASGGKEALQIVKEQGDRIRLVLLDYSMPGMDGVAVFKELRKIRPDIAVLLASGYSEEAVAERFKGLGLNGFIKKPFNLNCLVDALQRGSQGTQ